MIGLYPQHFLTGCRNLDGQINTAQGTASVIYRIGRSANGHFLIAHLNKISFCRSKGLATFFLQPASVTEFHSGNPPDFMDSDYF